MRKLSLQWKVTLMTAAVLCFCTLLLTVFSIKNAEPLAGAQNLPDAYIISGSDGDVLEEMPLSLAKQEFDQKSIMFCILVTFCGSACVYLLCKKTLQPLQKLSLAVATYDASNLKTRIPQFSTQHEITQLTDSFNSMLDGMEDTFERQQQFTYNAAHEFNTPLALMKTGLQVVLEDPDADLKTCQDENRAMLESVERLSIIVRDLLMLSSQKTLPLENMETVELEPLVEAVLEENAPLIQESGIQVHLDLLAQEAFGSASAMIQVLNNLVVNACKYAGKNSSLWIRSKKAGSMVQILVEDDGPGISRGDQAHIFDAFYRIDKSRSRSLGGSGLGLSIAKAMMQACHGTIRVESDGKTGTCFILEFPATIQKGKPV